MKTRLSFGFAAGFLAMTVLVGTAAAQNEGQRGRGGRGFGQTSLISLAGRQAVQTELGLGETEKGKIEEIQRDFTEARRDELSNLGVDFRNFQDLSDEERRAAREKMAVARRKVNDKFEPKLKEALSAGQFQRLQEIYLWVEGTDALTDPRVAKELALTEEQIEKIADIRSEYEQKRRSLFGQDAGDEARARARELRGEEEKNINEVLTKQQHDKLTALKGKEFDRSQLRRGGGDGNRRRQPQQEN